MGCASSTAAPSHNDSTRPSQQSRKGKANTSTHAAATQPIRVAPVPPRIAIPSAGDDQPPAPLSPILPSERRHRAGEAADGNTVAQPISAHVLPMKMSPRRPSPHASISYVPAVESKEETHSSVSPSPSPNPGQVPADAQASASSPAGILRPSALRPSTKLHGARSARAAQQSRTSNSSPAGDELGSGPAAQNNWLQSMTPTNVRSLRSNKGKIPRGASAAAAAAPDRSTLGFPSDRGVERSFVEKSTFVASYNGGSLHLPIYDREHSEIVRAQEEEIINARHAPRAKGGRLVPAESLRQHSHRGVSAHGHNVSMTRDLTAQPMTPTDDGSDMEESHTYTYHALISHTRAGVEAEEERLRERARERAEEERERAFRAHSRLRPPPHELLYDRSQALNYSAYAYATRVTRTPHLPHGGGHSVLHSYAAGPDYRPEAERADSPLVAYGIEAYADADEQTQLHPYDASHEAEEILSAMRSIGDAADPALVSAHGSNAAAELALAVAVAAQSGRISVTASTPLPSEEKENDRSFADSGGLGMGSNPTTAPASPLPFLNHTLSPSSARGVSSSPAPITPLSPSPAPFALATVSPERQADKMVQPAKLQSPDALSNPQRSSPASLVISA